LIEEELDDQEISQKAPGDGAVLKDENVSFWWTRIENITGYQLLVITPEFKKIERIVIDSTLTKERFDCKLSNGVYEWLVRAFNTENELVSDTLKFEVSIPEEEK
jgi:hypothetical protein